MFNPVTPLKAGEPLTLERALLLANQYNENLDLRGEEYVQALIQQTRATANFQPTINVVGAITE